MPENELTPTILVCVCLSSEDQYVLMSVRLNTLRLPNMNKIFLALCIHFNMYPPLCVCVSVCAHVHMCVRVDKLPVVTLAIVLFDF